MHAIIFAPDADDFERCRSYCEEHGIVTNAPIPFLAQAVDEACAQQLLLIAHRLPDLADSLKGLRDLTRRLNAHGAAWATVAESLSSRQKPVGKLLESLAVIEHEAHVRKGQRAASARKGKVMTLHPGKVRYGWKLVDGQLVEDEREQKAIADIVAWRLTGATPSQICARLQMFGYQPRGQRWLPDTVKKILEREASKGGNGHVEAL